MEEMLLEDLIAEKHLIWKLLNRHAKNDCFEDFFLLNSLNLAEVETQVLRDCCDDPNRSCCTNSYELADFRSLTLFHLLDCNWLVWEFEIFVYS